ncbi:hypothetical protein L218DRAFT_87975 [Marasmius fiardii PR-910]|nr:hypothetical protein L218DRAFT_87975 [Marasmius fiardii PR-910]
MSVRSEEALGVADPSMTSAGVVKDKEEGLDMVEDLQWQSQGEGEETPEEEGDFSEGERDGSVVSPATSVSSRTSGSHGSKSSNMSRCDTYENDDVEDLSLSKPLRAEYRHHQLHLSKRDRQLIRDLQLSLGKQTHTVMQLESSNEQLLHALSSQRRKIATVKEEKKRLEVEIGEIRFRLEEHEEAVDIYDEQVDELTVENEELKGRLGEQAGVIAGLNEDIEEYMRENRILKGVVDEMKRGVVDVRRIVCDKDRMLEEERKVVVRERELNRQKDVELVGKCVELEEVKKRNVVLEEVMEELKKELEVRDFESAGVSRKGKEKEKDPVSFEDRNFSSSESLLSVTSAGVASASGMNTWTTLLKQRSDSEKLLDHEMELVAEILEHPPSIQDPAVLEMVSSLIKALRLAYFVIEEDDAVFDHAQKEILRLRGKLETEVDVGRTLCDDVDEGGKMYVGDYMPSPAHSAWGELLVDGTRVREDEAEVEEGSREDQGVEKDSWTSPANVEADAANVSPRSTGDLSTSSCCPSSGKDLEDVPGVVEMSPSGTLRNADLDTLSVGEPSASQSGSTSSGSPNVAEYHSVFNPRRELSFMDQVCRQLPLGSHLHPDDPASDARTERYPDGLFRVLFPKYRPS